MKLVREYDGIHTWYGGGGSDWLFMKFAVCEDMKDIHIDNDNEEHILRW
jgi:hypothetical protein